MARRAQRRPGWWVAVAAVAILAAGVGVLGLTAVQRVERATTTGTAAPVPTFSFGTRTSPPPSAGATPAEVESPAAREAERFLSVGASAMWRATAGVCGRVPPLLERSSDRGATWTDVTPRYLGIAQIASLEAFAGTEAQLVAATGSGCQTQALRTFTQGAFWETFDLGGARYLDLADASSVREGTAVSPAPCANATGLRAGGSTVAMVCDRAAWSWDGAAWRELSAREAVAVAIDGSDILVAQESADCPGVAVTRFSGAGASAAPEGCAEGADPTAPTAIAVSADGIWVWSEDVLRLLP